MIEFDVWLKDFADVTIRPFPNTFSRIAEHSQDKWIGGSFWLAVLMAIVSVSPILVGQPVAFALMVFGAVLLPIGALLWAACLNYLTNRLSYRTRNLHDKLYYSLVCILIPTTLIGLIVAFFPIPFGILNLIVLLYQLLLIGIAVQAITKLKLWQTVVVTVLGSTIALAMIACMPMAIFSLSQSVAKIY